MLPFISHHVPTAAQAATVRDRFGQLVCTDPIVFEPGSVVAACWRAVQAVDPAWTRFPCPRDHDDGCDCTPTVAGVFPGWALLELVRAGWAVVEFVNEPGARQRARSSVAARSSTRFAPATSCPARSRWPIRRTGRCWPGSARRRAPRDPLSGRRPGRAAGRGAPPRRPDGGQSPGDAPAGRRRRHVRGGGGLGRLYALGSS
jgi:hypothetical protein